MLKTKRTNLAISTAYRLNDVYLEKVGQERYIKEGEIEGVTADDYKIVQPDGTMSLAESKRPLY